MKRANNTPDSNLIHKSNATAAFDLHSGTAYTRTIDRPQDHRGKINDVQWEKSVHLCKKLTPSYMRIIQTLVRCQNVKTIQFSFTFLSFVHLVEREKLARICAPCAHGKTSEKKGRTNEVKFNFLYYCCVRSKSEKKKQRIVITFTERLDGIFHFYLFRRVFQPMPFYCLTHFSNRDMIGVIVVRRVSGVIFYAAYVSIKFAVNCSCRLVLPHRAWASIVFLH